ncbi:MAG: MBL fold metallo-hydrolase, partial [Candidatus Thorarchaeota archaeon]
MVLQHVVDRVYSDMSGNYGGNFGAVVLEDQVVMIDSGMVHTQMAKVKNWIIKEFDLPITKLVYTHSHSDHVFGAQGLGEISRISSYPMYEHCIENMQDNWKHEKLISGFEPRKDERPELWEALQTLEVQLPDLTFEESLKIGISEDLSIQLSGGHTSGSSIISVEPEHVVFIGDLIFNKKFPYIGDTSCNPDLWLHALQKI